MQLSCLSNPLDTNYVLATFKIKVGVKKAELMQPTSQQTARQLTTCQQRDNPNKREQHYCQNSPKNKTFWCSANLTVSKQRDVNQINNHAVHHHSML